MRPFEVALPLDEQSGFLVGTGSVLMAFCKRYSGRSYLFRTFEARRGGELVWGWSACAAPEQVSTMWYRLLEKCGMSRAACSAVELRPYGPRHVLPDVTRAKGWPLEDRMELGRWSVVALRSLMEAIAAETGRRMTSRKRASSSLSSACANLYSRGRAAMEWELLLRRRACAVVRDFIGERGWQQVVPVQREAPSFPFLLGEGEEEPGIDVPGEEDDELE